MEINQKEKQDNMEFNTNVEYTGKISSVTIIDPNGNPTNQVTLNPQENSFTVIANIQFFNLLPDTTYQYLLEVDRALDSSTAPDGYKQTIKDHGGTIGINDLQMGATAQIIELNKKNLKENSRVSNNGYAASTTAQINHIPIRMYDNYRTCKIKVSFLPVGTTSKEDIQIFETFISLPQNAYRPGLPIPDLKESYPDINSFEQNSQ